MVPTSTQAERSLKIQPLHRLNEVSKNGGASPPRTAFVHVPNFDQNRNFFDPGLYTGGVFTKNSTASTQVERSLKIQPLHRLNEVSKKWRSVSFTEASLVHCPNFGSNRNFIDPGRTPIICGRQQGVQDICLFFYFILKLTKIN
ncbi:hypothetical protein TNCV_4801 [Trichonephila clavipes]|nr:hypothetical protein TNCV_4801 [Trichonephila clavipes]